MSREYTVYGDYGYATETELYTTNSLKKATEWAQRYCERDDMGGFDIVEVAYHNEDGEYMTEWKKETEEKFLYDEF
jgi:hypothetical protein